MADHISIGDELVDTDVAHHDRLRGSDGLEQGQEDLSEHIVELRLRFNAEGHWKVLLFVAIRLLLRMIQVVVMLILILVNQLILWIP